MRPRTIPPASSDGPSGRPLAASQTQTRPAPGDGGGDPATVRTPGQGVEVLGEPSRHPSGFRVPDPGALLRADGEPVAIRAPAQDLDSAGLAPMHLGATIEGPQLPPRLRIPDRDPSIARGSRESVPVRPEREGIGLVPVTGERAPERQARQVVHADRGGLRFVGLAVREVVPPAATRNRPSGLTARLKMVGSPGNRSVRSAGRHRWSR